MPTVQLTITLPPDLWVSEITGLGSVESALVLTVMINEGRGHAVFDVETDTPGSILSLLRSRSEPQSVDLLSVDETRGIFQIETERTAILEPFLSAGVPLDTPIRIEDGEATWRFTTSQERLITLSAQLEESSMTYQVERIHESESTETAGGPDLTERQQEVLTVADELGYFEFPRGSTIETVAAKTGVSKSTANEILRRAVRNLVKWHQ